MPVSHRTIEAIKYNNLPLSKSVAWMVDRVEEKLLIHHGAKYNFDNWIKNIEADSSIPENLARFRDYVSGTLDITIIRKKLMISNNMQYVVSKRF